MSGGLPKRGTWADDTDSDVDEASVVQRKSAPPKKQGMSWADSDTESDVENAPRAPEKKRDPFGQSESESEESEESEGEEEEEEEERGGGGDGGATREASEGKSGAQGQRAQEGHGGSGRGGAEAGTEGGAGGSAGMGPRATAPAGSSSTAALAGSDPYMTQNLSKRERAELRKKELDDLDALLGEFGVDAPPAEEPEAPAPTNGGGFAAGTAGGEVDARGGSGDASKKSKKKKKKDKKEAEGPKVQSAPPTESPVVVVQPIATALKGKGKKKASSATAKPTAAALKAHKEAQEAAEKEAKKKKKKDKKNFNQAPPGK